MLPMPHYGKEASVQPTAQTAQSLISWAEQWYQSARAAFLRGYHAIAGEAPFSPRSHQEFNLLLDTHLLDKALYELAYELNNRPDWVDLPLTGILQCMNTSSAASDRDGRPSGKTIPVAPARPTSMEMW